MYDPASYEERQARNERSRAWADRDGSAWTDQEDYALLEAWVMRDSTERDETQISKDLHRTIEACRNRAHHLRRLLGIANEVGPYEKTTVTITKTTITPRRPAWMDEEGWPDWYVS